MAPPLRIGTYQAAQAELLISSRDKGGNPQDLASLAHPNDTRLSPRNQRLVVCSAAIRKFETVKTLVASNCQTRCPTPSVEQCSKGLLSNPIEALLQLLCKRADCTSTAPLETALRYRLAFSDSKEICDIQMNQLNIYTTDAIRCRDGDAPTAGLCREMANQYADTMFEDTDAALIKNQLRDMNDATIMSVTTERGGLYTYLDKETRSKVSLSPPFLSNGDNEVPSLSNEVGAKLIHRNTPLCVLNGDPSPAADYLAATSGSRDPNETTTVENNDNRPPDFNSLPVAGNPKATPDRSGTTRTATAENDGNKSPGSVLALPPCRDSLMCRPRKEPPLRQLTLQPGPTQLLFPQKRLPLPIQHRKILGNHLPLARPTLRRKPKQRPAPQRSRPPLKATRNKTPLILQAEPRPQVE